jgi:hypothetical protein
MDNNPACRPLFLTPQGQRRQLDNDLYPDKVNSKAVPMMYSGDISLPICFLLLGGITYLHKREVPCRFHLRSSERGISSFDKVLCDSDNCADHSAVESPIIHASSSKFI